MRSALKAIWLIVLCLAGCRGVKDTREQVVIVNGTIPGPLALWLGDDELESAGIEIGHHEFLVRGRAYPLNWYLAEEQFKERSVEGRLTIRNGALVFDGRTVRLPRGLEARDIWQAIEWNGWVICLGRTSATDLQTKMEPPFFASELITFETSRLVATVQWLAPSAPSAASLLVVDPIQGAHGR